MLQIKCEQMTVNFRLSMVKDCREILDGIKTAYFCII